MVIGKRKNIPGLSLVGADLEKMESLLVSEVRSEVRLVMEVSGHIMGSGGKRFRPLLTLLAGRLTGLKRKKELLAYAAAIELAHTSTLLHDDVIDEADLRRGARSANRAFGNAPSIIVGDYLLFKAFSLTIAGRDPRVVQYLARIAVTMAEGEAYQLTQKSRLDLNEQEYERIIRSKTALLIQAACEIPAIAAGADRRRRNAAAQFGYRLGLAFQIVDDALDYAATDDKWGKQVGKDFLESKTTLPLIIAYQRASAAERAEIKRLFKKPDKKPADYRELLDILDRLGAVDAAKDRARQNVETAKKKLQVFPDGPVRQALADLADFVVDRSV